MTSALRFYNKPAQLIPFFCLMMVTSSFAQTNDTTIKAGLQNMIRDILTVWDTTDVVCLGEAHGDQNDSRLRIALVEHPDFVRKVNVIIVEFADTVHQDIIDSFIIRGKDLSREKLSVVWADLAGADVWNAPIYETFLRTVRKVNLQLPENKKIRLIGGGNSREKNRGRYIREVVSREILSKGLKGLAIYGSRHCECRGTGFPGELADRYPGKIWSASGFYGEEGIKEGRRLLGLGKEPALIRIKGTDKMKIPVGKMFFGGKYNDPATLGNVFNGILYYGDSK